MHGGVAVVGLGVDAVHAVLLEEDGEQRPQRLAGEAATLRGARERHADLGRRGLLVGHTHRAVAVQHAGLAFDRRELRPRADLPELEALLPCEERLGVGHGPGRLPGLVPRDLRVASVRDERGQVLGREGAQDEPPRDDLETRHDPGMFLDSRPPDDPGDAAAIYANDREVFGHLPTFTRAFSLRPDVYAAWRGLIGAVKAEMDPRRYELASVAAARALDCSYCMLAHGAVLARDHLDAEEALRVATGDASPLTPTEQAVIRLAEQVTTDATAVTQADIDELRELGLADAAILDVILAASVRCFFAKVLDATGALPDARFAELPATLRDALTGARPIATT